MIGYHDRSAASGYLVYFFVTWARIGPKAAVSFLYPVGVAVGFFGNRQWAFAYSSHLGASVVRFLSSHAMGYSINIALLYVFVDRIGLPHQLVQLLDVGVVAVFLFVAPRFFAFPTRRIPREN